MNDFHGFEETVKAVTENVVALSKKLNLEVETDDVTELLASHGEELSAEDLIQLEKQIIEDEEDTSTPESKRFTSKGLAEVFALIDDALAKLEAQDPNTARYSKVYRGIMDCLVCYKEIWEEKRNTTIQSRMERFFKKVERSAAGPVPSTSAASLPPPMPSAGSQDSPAPVSPAPSAGPVSPAPSADFPASPTSSSH